MQEQPVTITSIREVQVATAQGRLEPHMVVSFTVGKHGPFTEEWPKAAFDANAVNAKLKAFAGQLALVQGA